MSWLTDPAAKSLTYTEHMAQKKDQLGMKMRPPPPLEKPINGRWGPAFGHLTLDVWNIVNQAHMAMGLMKNEIGSGTEDGMVFYHIRIGEHLIEAITTLKNEDLWVTNAEFYNKTSIRQSYGEKCIRLAQHKDELIERFGPDLEVGMQKGLRFLSKKTTRTRHKGKTS